VRAGKIGEIQKGTAMKKRTFCHAYHIIPGFPVVVIIKDGKTHSFNTSMFWATKYLKMVEGKIQ